MKKLTNFFVVLLLLINVVVIVPTVNAEEIPPYDYSSFVGEWHKIDPDGLNGDVPLNIINVNDNREITFSLDNRAAVTGIIQDNQVQWTEEWYDGSMGLTLTFYDNHIHLQYSRYSHEWYSEITFVSNRVKPRRIETGNYSVLLNGEKLEFDQQPIMCGDRILVPFRKILEVMNADVYYDTYDDIGISNYCIISAIKNNLVFQISKSDERWSFYKANLYDNTSKESENINIDVNPIILNGRTLVPVRAITECFGAEVSWDESSKTVFIKADTTGKRKTQEEIEQCDSFTCATAHKIAENTGLRVGGNAGNEMPCFDVIGKFFTFPASDNNYDDVTGSITIYYNGRIVYLGNDGRLTVIHE